MEAKAIEKRAALDIADKIPRSGWDHFVSIAVYLK
jgi:hypothetical protein